jgi:heterocycloanthracin/sonorensin family bacteriocin
MQYQKKLMEVFKMNDFHNDLQQLSGSQFQASEMTPWDQQSQYPAGQFPGLNPADPSRLCVGFGGFCGGFGGGFCSGFGGGFCGGFGGGFCGGFGGGFCGGFHRCGGFCGGFHHCGGFGGHRCR